MCQYIKEVEAIQYGFAQAIFNETKSKLKLCPIKTKGFPTTVQRPYSTVLDKPKIKENLNKEIPNKRHSLKKAICNLNQIENP